ncbi:unnamed protein product [Cochlearia groenlandica]
MELRSLNKRRNVMEKCLEAEAESLNAKDTELEATCGVQAKLVAEVDAHSEPRRQLNEYHQEEVDRLCRSRFDHVQARKLRFESLREASEARLGKLNLFLDEGMRFGPGTERSSNGLSFNLSWPLRRSTSDSPRIYVLVLSHRVVLGYSVWTVVEQCEVVLSFSVWTVFEQCEVVLDFSVWTVLEQCEVVLGFTVANYDLDRLNSSSAFSK